MWFIEFIRSLMLPRYSRLFSTFTKEVYIITSKSIDSDDEVKMSEEKLKLKVFLDFLQENCGFKFDVTNFAHRIKLQKYVFIAKFLGWPSGYDYNIYVRGPYSPDLAKDYYGLDDISTLSNESKELLSNLDKERFIQIIQKKRIAWLEVGTTMLSLYDNNKNKIKDSEINSFLLERTKDIKSDYEDEFIKQVFDNLSEHGLIK